MGYRDMSKSLLGFAENIHSQNGEDGIIAEILRRLSITSGWFVEFGAWDGKRMSNTWNLAERGWSGVFIESNVKKFRELQQNTKTLCGSIHTIHSWVAIGGPRSLDNLLAKIPLPPNFDVLSIDIDSYDYFVWQSLTRYSPRIVIIEINSSFAPQVRRTHREDSIRPGSSFRSVLELGTAKGYTLVCHTGNMIFVKSELASKLNLPAAELRDPQMLFVDTWRKRWILDLPLCCAKWLRTKVLRIVAQRAEG